jgi:hypothetical protein
MLCCCQAYLETLTNYKYMSSMNIDDAVMARLRTPFDCEFINNGNPRQSRWRIHDANDDAIASVSGLEEGYARLIVQALNDYCKS